MNKKYSATTFFHNSEARTFMLSSVSFILTGIFLVYNACLGILYHSLWNCSIGFYYLLLCVLRGTIIYSERSWRYHEKEERELKRVRLFQHISKVLILLDIALIIPTFLMVFLQRRVVMDMISAIGIATYTTYKVVLAIINYKKASVHENISLYGLRFINLKDAAVSVLTLQNTMVMVFSDGTSMLVLTAYTSAGILVGMMVLTILLIKKRPYHPI